MAMRWRRWSTTPYRTELTRQCEPWQTADTSSSRRSSGSGSETTSASEGEHDIRALLDIETAYYADLESARLAPAEQDHHRNEVRPIQLASLAAVRRQCGWVACTVKYSDDTGGVGAMGHREEAMTAVRTRALELMSTVTFHEIGRDELELFTAKLADAVRAVLPEYPAVGEYLVGPDPETGDINFGLRFISVDPDFADDMADEVLAKAVELIAEEDGAPPADVEREESVLLLTR